MTRRSPAAIRPVRSAGRAEGLTGFGALTSAERKLRDEVGQGHLVEISGGVPEADAPEVRVRASFIRYLALGGCPACRPHAKGVLLSGAWIVGDGPEGAETRGLDLEGCTLEGDLALMACRIPDKLHLGGASIHSLFLNASRLEAGIRADRLNAKGDLFLSNA